MMRERMSRPNSSAPRRNFSLGRARFSMRLCLTGSAGASHGAPAPSHGEKSDHDEADEGETVAPEPLPGVGGERDGGFSGHDSPPPSPSLRERAGVRVILPR